MSDDRITRLRTRLTDALNPIEIEIIDESARHAGHAGAASGGGHYILHIMSEAFAGKSLIQRHRLVYDAVGDMMHSEIHALSIQARSPDE
ncbi:MAG: BolA family transcriptional regulator [Gammaproteobacteria bacterium]|nr:MAG: BolA family transcriptional regulator [Gammaproteobacteria bacterium]